MALFESIVIPSLPLVVADLYCISISAMSPYIIDFYYDIVSPFALFAFNTLIDYQPQWNFTLRLKPVFLGAIIHATKNTRKENRKKGAL